MATRSFRLLTTGNRDQSSAVANDTAGGTIIANGAIEVLINDAEFKDKGQIIAALEAIRGKIVDTAFALTGTK